MGSTPQTYGSHLQESGQLQGHLDHWLLAWGLYTHHATWKYQ